MKLVLIARIFFVIILFNVTLVAKLSATIFTVDNAANTDDFAAAAAGTMTFVKCIRLASADATGGALGHRIYFNITPAGQKILTVNSTWQQLNSTNLNNLIIDGTTQPFAGVGPHIMFVSGGITEGIQISGLTNVTLIGLGFRDFQISIKMDNATSCTISNCFMGTNNAGDTPQCTNCNDAAIRMNNGCVSNLIGGSTASTRNIIFGHRFGIYITGAGSNSNIIGSTMVGEPNVISGHSENGIYIQNAGVNNRIAGNIIGLDVAGTTASLLYSNDHKGILVQGTQSTIIGGTSVGERNIVSGNGYGVGHDGIFLENNCHSSQITNCYIGLDVTGVVPLKNNLRGILILNSNNCQVSSNRIAGHDQQGIYLQTSSGTNIKANYIGINALGNGAPATLGNQIGINVENCTGTIIGSSNSADCNYISGNREHGIRLDRGSTAIISGNKIGISPSGGAIGNQAYGIYLHNSDNNTIGGATTAHGNEIANNSSSGIGLSNAYWSGDGSPDASGADNNLIYRNVIHHNSEDGVRLYKVGAAASVTNWLSENSIYCNSGIGINLTLSTGNNNNKPAPVLTGVVVATNTVSGTASANDFIEVFIDNGCPTCQGKTFLGSTTANGSGVWSYTNPAITSTNNLTATATDGSGANRNTSQFATCISVLPVTFVSFEGKALEPNTVILSWTTLNEVNNDYFEIERSYDGVNFNPIGRVQGQGTSSSVYNYSFTDHQVTYELAYYRIIQRDFDGMGSATSIINVSMSDRDKIEVYPNPTKEKLFIHFSMDKGNVSLAMINSVGQEVYLQTFYDQDRYFNKTLNLENFAKGFYILSIKTHSTEWKQKIIIE